MFGRLAVCGCGKYFAILWGEICIIVGKGMKEYKKFKEKETFEKKLTVSFKEIKETEAGRKKAMTLKEFLDEF